MARWLALLVLLGAALAQTPLELEAFRLTNEARKAHGLAALAWDDAAYRAARAHALDMLERGFFDHVNPDGLGPADRMWAAGVLEVTVGENLAFYEGYTPEYAAGVVVDDWLRSPPHRRNLLKPEFTHLGLALVQRGTASPWCRTSSPAPFASGSGRPLRRNARGGSATRAPPGRPWGCS
ncbi:MAG TPA: CAP domain-containing protein [Oceanithermus profundus]|uniref:CAP domain-containing protein n=1 Tax=Oceanithermus profundus TaxID=187137 RepID=A0A7C5WQD7_9DEIN|nr:CAP domain-containing protein [Oceanithermus profundus]